ncbi:chemotaxis protein CheA [Candidatus Bathyarchaeota archaeon]|nr:chemotaxis protein CheA [Candidatus Bathyarchaeota archaeon]
METNEYRELFIEEAREHIDALTKSLLVLEKNSENIEVVNMLFRSAHTLKGSSGMMGYADLQGLTHAMEDVFDDMRKGKKPSSNLISVLLECVDALSSKLENIQNMVEREINVADLILKLQAASELPEEPEKIESREEIEETTFIPITTLENVGTSGIELSETEKEAVLNAESFGEHCYFVDLKFSKDCAFKSVRSILVISKISELAEIIKTQPEQREIEAFKEERLDFGLQIAITSKYEANEIEKCARQVCEIEAVSVAPFNPTAPREIKLATTVETEPTIEAETTIAAETETAVETTAAEEVEAEEETEEAEIVETSEAEIGGEIEAEVDEEISDEPEVESYIINSAESLPESSAENHQQTPQVALLEEPEELEDEEPLPVETVESTTVELEEAPVAPCVDKPSGQVSEATRIFAEVRAAQTVRVKFEQLDKIMNLVGELVINKIALLQVTSEDTGGEIKRIAGNIDRLTSDLHDLVMQVRMVPASQIFDRFPRLVRDISLQKGKEIDLLMEGRDIEIDRTVLDEIGEPLIHLLRNSIDHGIETPDERKKAGKNPVGKIRLSAQRSGDNVIIEVEDDGAGLDPERLRASAIEKGFASEEEAEKMSRNELVSMIFLPGFSTSNEVTETSGRGIGMDVVKTKIAALGGTVQFETRRGRGTKTSIKVPLTLAIIKAILVQDSGQTFTIPTSQVSEIVKANRNDIKVLGRTDAIVVRGKVVPVVHLHKLLGLEGSNEEEFELLITHLGDEKTKLGLVVDSVLRQQDILVKPISDTLKSVRGISGATILGDGQVVLVLDVGQFINKAHQNA